MGTALQAPNLEETVQSMQQCVDHVQQPRFTVASLLRMRHNAEIRITIVGESIMESVSISPLCHLHRWRLLMTWNLQTLATTGKLRQGQARGYGRITQKRGRTTGGHYFQDLFTA